MLGKNSSSLQGSNAQTPYGALDELHHLANAKAFNQWILDAIELPANLDSVLEIGAGIGTMTKLVAARCSRAMVTSLEPSDEPFAELSQRHIAGSFGANVKIVNETSSQHLAQGSARFDAVVHVNVLEHIENDLEELKTVSQLLRPGGTLHLFVPAIPALFGPLDAKSGHYRRYTKKQLAAIIEAAGFRINKISYFDLLGTPVYFILSKILKKSTISAGDVAKFDRIWVAISKQVDRLFGDRAPVGKNLLVVATLK